MAERTNADQVVTDLILAAAVAAPGLPVAELLAPVRVRLPWYASLPFADLFPLGQDRHGDLRAQVACTLFAGFQEEHHRLIRFILEQEIAYAGHAYNDCYMVTLMACCLMLYKLGHVEDALLISDAKACCFDAQVLIDGYLMCGAGVDETLRHLRSLGTDDAKEMVDYLESCQRHGELQDLSSKVAGYEAKFRADYAEALES
jgi:hypothetical protein